MPAFANDAFASEARHNDVAADFASPVLTVIHDKQNVGCEIQLRSRGRRLGSQSAK